MPKNDFLALAKSPGANVKTQAEYAALVELFTNGFSAGVVESRVMNKILRQSSAIARLVAQYMADLSGDDVLDDGNDAALLATLKKALAAQIDAQSGNYCVDTGTANAKVIALDPPITAYPDGLTARFRNKITNTLAVTINAGGGDVPLRNNVGAPLIAGDLPADAVVTITYVAGVGFVVNSTVPSQAPSLPAGMIFDHAGTSAPAGALLCPTSPANISRTTYTKLFAAIGTTWGAGDGATTFGMPWFPADYATVQANGNVGTQTTGAVISHTHGYTHVTGTLPVQSGGNNAPVYNTSGAATSAATGGAGNMAAGSRVLKCVQY